MTCTLPCRCGHDDYAHTGAYGIATACTGPCGCSFFEPDLPDPEPVESEPIDQGYELPTHDGGYLVAMGMGLRPRSAL